MCKSAVEIVICKGNEVSIIYTKTKTKEKTTRRSTKKKKTKNNNNRSSLTFSVVVYSFGFCLTTGSQHSFTFSRLNKKRQNLMRILNSVLRLCTHITSQHNKKGARMSSPRPDRRHIRPERLPRKNNPDVLSPQKIRLQTLDRP